MPFPCEGSRVAPFLLAETPCTHKAWRLATGSWKNPSCKWARSGSHKTMRRPVEDASREAARVFCERAGLQLPSEAEWEYACRGGSPDTYPCGVSASEVDALAWCKESCGPTQFGPRDCAGLLPNSFGLYDMLGNVWEWCSGPRGGGVVRGGTVEHPRSKLVAGVKKEPAPALAGFRPAASLRHLLARGNL